MSNKFALIIGAMKSGTTSLFKHLSEHPQICPCELKKEPQFFSDDTNFSQGFDGYKKLWNYDDSIHKIRLEGSTAYTKLCTPKVVRRIFEFQTQHTCDFRFIYIMRDPIERIESHYTHALCTDWGKSLKRLEEGIDRKLIEISSYAKQLDEYYNKFSKNKILLLNFNDFKANAPTVLKQTCRFLEVDASFEFKNTSKNYHPTHGKLIEGNLWPFVKPVTRFMPSKQREAIRQLLGHKIKSRVQLSKGQRRFICRELSDDLHNLTVNYGVDTSRWNLEPDLWNSTF